MSKKFYNFRDVIFNKKLLLLTIFSLTLFSIIGVPKYFTQTSNPNYLIGVGAWNGYLNHQSILECSNMEDKKTDAELNILDDKSNLLGVESISIVARGSHHLVLNKFGIADKYGILKLTSHSPVKLDCKVVTYKLDGRGIQYATNMPLENLIKGKSFGVINSVNPQTGSKLPVSNWLTVFNPGEVNFTATLDARDLDGNIKKTLDIALKPDSRIDVPLFHPDGMAIGQYSLTPKDSNQKYGAFLSRYSQDSRTGDFYFSMFIPASTGLNSSGVVSASTMKSAVNWAEIVNVNPTKAKVHLQIFSQDSKVLYDKTIVISPYGQHHLYINEILGINKTGYFKAESFDGKIIVQSLVYGEGPSGSLDWAYNVSAQGDAYYNKIEFPVNTYLKAGNFLKLFNPNSNKLDLNIEIRKADGASLVTKQKSFQVSGSLDLPIHDEVGANFTGTVIVSSKNKEDQFKAELTRVYGLTDPKSKAIGKVSYLMPVLANLTIALPDIDPGGSHRMCVGALCKSVTGFGPDNCSKNSDCAHRECNAEEKCVVVYSSGYDECANNNNCISHRECDYFMPICYEIDRPGIDSCSSHAECKFKKVCDGALCITSRGKDPDECSSDEDCGYRACNSEGYCVREPGDAPDECSSFIDCKNRTWHSECHKKVEPYDAPHCQRVEGPGDDQCDWENNNNNCTRKKCISGSCLETFGEGVDECSANIDCR